MRRTGFMLAAMLTALLMVSGVALAKVIVGTPKNDRITGTDWGDVVSARGGTDTVVGRGGDDELSGGNNNDTIDALGDGRDSINCGLGSDDQVIADEVDGVNINDCEKITQK